MGFIEKIVGAMIPSSSEEATAPQADVETEKTDEESTVEPAVETVSSDEEAGQEESKTYTQEDLQKVLDENRKSWEQERLQSMSKDDQIKQLQAEILKRDLKEKVHSRLEEAQLPLGVADLVQYSDEDGTMNSLNNTIKLVNQLVFDGIEMRLKGKTPQGLGRASENLNTVKDPFAIAFVQAMKE